MVVEGIRELVHSLPLENKILLRCIFAFLIKVLQHQDSSKMGAQNIAIVFGSNLLRPRDAQVLLIAL
jgi:RalA-binding protein 1